MKNLLPIIAVLMLSACGTTAQLTDADLHAPIGKGESRIIVSRDNSMLYGTAGAKIEVNGAEVATLGLGGQALKDVPAGLVTVSVSTMGSSGSDVAFVKAKTGKTYRLLVSPNEAHSLLPSPSTFLLGAGGTAYSNMHESTGWFKIAPVK